MSRAPGEDLRVALVQVEVEDGRRKDNLERGVALVRDAAFADLFLLPELWTTGYAHDCWEQVADDFTPGAVDILGDLATEKGSWIGGSMISRNRHGRLVNRFWLVPPDGGPLVHYDKGHLFGPMGEEERLQAGDRRVRVGIGPWTGALSLCYDLRFPEMYRLDAVSGAELYLVPAEWPAERKDTLDLLSRARAAENQAYLALCNRTGRADDGTVFGGGSMVVDPEGSVLGRAGSEEDLVAFDIDLSRVRRARRSIPVLDRRRGGLDWEDPGGPDSEAGPGGGSSSSAARRRDS